MNKKIKVAQKFELPILKEQKKINNDIININIKSSFNYVTELSSLKNFQVSSLKKKKITEEDIEKMKLFKELFYITKEKLVDINFRKKRYDRIKDKYIELKSYGVKQITLDPGKYHPKYDILYKRNPVVFFGTKGLIKKKGDNLENKKNENERYKKLNKNNSMDDININVISDKNKNNNKMDYFNIKNLKKKKIREKSGNINIQNEFKDINFNFRNRNAFPFSQTMYISNPHKYTISSGFLKIERINSFKISKQTSTNFNISTSKKKLLKKSSSELNINKIRCPIMFNKMSGRDRKLVRSKGYKEVNYTPNYDITRPHIPATIFKHSFNYSKFKKYITGKLIRSYCFTPDNYFVIEINKNMQNNLVVNKSKKINKDPNIFNYN